MTPFPGNELTLLKNEDWKSLLISNWNLNFHLDKTHFNSSVSVNYQLFLSWVMIKVPVTMLVEQEIVRTLGTILFYNVWIYTRFVLFYVCLMVFNATFNNISVISRRSVLLVEETGGTGEKNRPVASHWQILSHNVVHLALIEFRTRNRTDCIGSCKSNYHTIMATTAPLIYIYKEMCKWITYIYTVCGQMYWRMYNKSL